MNNYELINKWIGTPDYQYYKGYRRYLRTQSVKSIFDKSYQPLKDISYFRSSKFYDPYVGWSAHGYTEYIAEKLDKTINYTEYLSSKVTNTNTYIQYSDYLAEEIDKKFINGNKS